MFASILKSNASMLIGALISVLLQAFIAPYITIGYAMINFIMCYVIIMAIFRADRQSYIMAFVLGFFYDLIGSGCVGAMALVCVLLTFAISHIYTMLASEAFSVAVVLIVIGCFVGELAYGSLLILCGLDVSLLEALIYRILPCTLYDTVVSLIAYVLMARFVYGRSSSEPMQIIR